MKTILFAIGLFGSSFLVAQDLILIDESSGDPIKRGIVTDLRDSKVATSNALGEVFLEDFSPTDTLIISRLGYQEKLLFPQEWNSTNPYRVWLSSVVNGLGIAEIEVYGETAKREKVPQEIKSIGSGEIRIQQPNTSADVLLQSGEVMVQKSQLGGGSPIVRGFEANKILLVVDGVRMNNAIYRSGHVQNAITIDPMILDQTDIFYGPGAVIFGSDALGGAIHFRTKDPILQSRVGEAPLTVMNFKGTLGSAAQQQGLHANVMFGGQKLGFLTAVSYNQFGDLRMGSWRPHGDDNWGKVFRYASREEGVDVEKENGNPLIQRGTGYNQTDFFQKVLYRPSNSWEFLLNMQYSTSSNVPRFDRLNDVRDGQLRFAQWDYGPQTRFFVSGSAKHELDRKWADRAKLIVAHQRIDEDRIDRQFGNEWQTTNAEDVSIYSVNLNFTKQGFVDESQRDTDLEALAVINASWTLNYGLEFFTNDVVSTGTQFNITTGETRGAQTRYPNGGSDLWSAGAYASLQKIWSQKFTTTVGARYNQSNYLSRFNEDGFLQLPFDEVNIANGALTGTLGAVWQPDSLWRISTNLSTGFRNPNVDDYGKVFERDAFVVIPNNNVGPEYIYSAEMGASRSLLNERLSISLSGYFSFLEDAIVRRDFEFGGDTLLNINGLDARIQANTNAGQAIVYGGTFGLQADLRKDLSAQASLHYTYGQDISDQVPLAHIPPLFGRAGLKYFEDKFKAQLYVLYSAAKTLDRFAPGTTDNLVEGTEDGFPTWWTLNMKTSFQISNTFAMDFSLENILDRHYKAFASGLSAPGIDARISLRVRLD